MLWYECSQAFNIYFPWLVTRWCPSFVLKKCMMTSPIVSTGNIYGLLHHFFDIKNEWWSMTRFLNLCFAGIVEEWHVICKMGCNVDLMMTKQGTTRNFKKTQQLNSTARLILMGRLVVKSSVLTTDWKLKILNTYLTTNGTPSKCKCLTNW